MTTPKPPLSDYENLLSLVAVYTEASNRIDELNVSANKELLEIVEENREEFAKLQETAAEAEKAIELLMLRHPEWTEKKKSIKTAFGTVKSTASTKLQIPNEELTLALIAREPHINPEFKPDDYIRTEHKLNLEALETCDDATLARFKIQRVTTENISVTPAKVDLGKAIAANAETKKAA